MGASRIYTVKNVARRERARTRAVIYDTTQSNRDTSRQIKSMLFKMDAGVVYSLRSRVHFDFFPNSIHAIVCVNQRRTLIPIFHWFD